MKSTEEYKQAVQDLKELELKQVSLKRKLEEMQGQVSMQEFLKKSKKNDQVPEPKEMKQIKIQSFFQQKSSPQTFCKEIVQGILNQVAVILWPNQSGDILANFGNKDSIDETKRVKIKVSYSTQLKRSAQSYLKEHSLSNTYIHYDRQIPYSTLYDWKKTLKVSASDVKGKSGRKSPFKLLEQELFEWFLKCRARKLLVSQTTLVTKALKIAKSIVTDPSIELSALDKKAYIDFSASNGWVDKFKARFKIGKRFITTKCSVPIEQIRTSLKSYFDELNTFMDTKKPIYIFNMDEMAIFFELSKNYTLEVKGKKTVGQITSRKAKQRVTLIVTAKSNGDLLPPFIIFKCAKP